MGNGLKLLLQNLDLISNLRFSRICYRLEMRMEHIIRGAILQRRHCESRGHEDFSINVQIRLHFPFGAHRGLMAKGVGKSVHASSSTMFSPGDVRFRCTQSRSRREIIVPRIFIRFLMCPVTTPLRIAELFPLIRPLCFGLEARAKDRFVDNAELRREQVVFRGRHRVAIKSRSLLILDVQR